MLSIFYGLGLKDRECYSSSNFNDVTREDPYSLESCQWPNNVKSLHDSHFVVCRNVQGVKFYDYNFKDVVALKTKVS